MSITITGTTPIPSAESFGAGTLSGQMVGYGTIPTGEVFLSGGMIVLEKDFALYVRGIDRSGWLKVGTMEVSEEWNGRATATFVIDTAGHPSRRVYRPNPWDEVVYLFMGQRIFGGFVQTYKEKARDARSDLLITVQCVDYRQLADDRTFAKIYTGPTFDMRSIAYEIWYNTLRQENVIFDVRETIIIEGLRLVFNDEPVSACYDKLCQSFGCEWVIDRNRTLRIERQTLTLAPRVLRDDDGVWRGLEVTRSSKNYRNRQGVRTGVPTSGQRETTFEGNGIHQYLLGYSVTAAPFITVNTIPQVVIRYEDRGLFPYDFTYEAGTNIIRQDPAQAAYISSDEIVITHPSDTIDVLYLDDTNEIARRAARTGGSGIVESVTNAQSIRDKGMALAFAQRQLEANGGIAEEISFETDSKRDSPINWQTGQLIQAMVSAPLVAGLFVIQGLQVRERDATYLTWTIRAQARELPLIQGVEVDPIDHTITITVDRPIDGLIPGDPISIWGPSGLEPIWGTLPIDSVGPNTLTLTLPDEVDPGDLRYTGGLGGVNVDLGPIGTNGIDGTDTPYGGHASGGIPPMGGPDPGGTDGNGSIGTAGFVVIAVDNSNNEVTVDRPHGWSSSGTGDFRVATIGCQGTLAPSGFTINNPSSRIVVTAVDRFIMDDVGDLTSATPFVNDGHGRAYSTDQIIRSTPGGSPADGFRSFYANGTYLNNLDDQRATFLLATAIPGVASRPLQTGSAVTNAWTATRDLTVVDYVSATFETPPTGAPIIIDIKQNGTSIFAASSGLVIPDGTSTEVRVTSGFRETPLVVERGDKFTVDVNQVGTDFPGCGGTVILNTRG